MDIKELRDTYAKVGLAAILGENGISPIILRALDLLAAVEGSQDEIVRELWSSASRPVHLKAAAALVAMRAERDAANEAASMLTTMKKQAEAERDEAMRVLKLANDSCRSAYQIAARKGSETEWETWQFALQKSLNEQHRFMFPEQYSEDRRIRAHDRAATKDAP